MKQAAIPLPFALNDANFLKRLRSAAADSAHVLVMPHAKKRMRERKISMVQILACLKKGTISEPAHLTQFGDWKATVTHRAAGDMNYSSQVAERLVGVSQGANPAAVSS